jgi:polyphosphate kinase 2 (PPK2 family)
MEILINTEPEVIAVYLVLPTEQDPEGKIYCYRSEVKAPIFDDAGNVVSFDRSVFYRPEIEDIMRFQRLLESHELEEAWVLAHQHNSN